MAVKNEAKVKFLAETSAFNSDIKTAAATMSSLRSELKLNETQLAETGDRSEYLSNKQKILEAQVEQSKNKIDALSGKVEAAAKIYGENSEQVQKYQTELNNALSAESKIQVALNQCVAEIDSQKTAFSKLTTEISDQEQKLSALKTDYANVILEQGDASEAAKTLAGKIGSLSSELENNKTKLNDAKDAAEKLDTSFDNVGNSAKDSGDKVKKSADGYTVLKDVVSDLASNAIAGALDGIKNMTESVLEAADSVQELSDETGMSAEQIQKWQYIGDNLGVSIDTITGAQMKLTKSMSAARDGTGTQADAFAQLGVSVTDANGDLRDAQTVMGEAFDALGSVGNETERNALSMAIFGRSAADLNPLIKAGSATMDELAASAEKSGAIMSGETVSALDDFGDTLGETKTAVMGAIGSAIAPALETLTGTLKNMDFTPLTNFVGFIVEHPAVVGIVVGLAGALGAFALIGAAAPILIGIAGGIKAITLAMAANPIGLIITVIAILLPILVNLFTSNEAVKDGLISAWNKIKDVAVAVFGAIKDFFVTIFNAIKTVITGIWDGIKTYFTTIFEVYKTIFSTAFNAIKTVVTTVFNSIKAVATTVWEGIKSVIITPITTAKDTVTTVIGTIKDKVSSVFTGIKNTVSNVWDGIKSAITTPIEKAKDIVSGIIDKIKGFFNFKISWPNIPTPHFGISPAGWKIGDLLHGSIPKLSIKWYAKGGIFDRPTLFRGVGEAGPEAVTPISVLQNYVSTAVAAGMQAMNFDRMASAIENLAAKDTDLYIDGYKVATATASSSDNVSGQRTALKSRGVALP